jgi:hypothetical protein
MLKRRKKRCGGETCMLTAKGGSSENGKLNDSWIEDNQ